MVYLLVFKNYDHTYAVRTNRYDEEVVSIFEWYLGTRYDLWLVLENPIILLKHEYFLETKDEILEELDIRVHGYWYDEEGEDLERKANLLKSILAD